MMDLVSYSGSNRNTVLFLADMRRRTKKEKVEGSGEQLHVGRRSLLACYGLKQLLAFKSAHYSLIRYRPIEDIRYPETCVLFWLFWRSSDGIAGLDDGLPTYVLCKSNSPEQLEPVSFYFVSYSGCFVVGPSRRASIFICVRSRRCTDAILISLLWSACNHE